MKKDFKEKTLDLQTKRYSSEKNIKIIEADRSDIFLNILNVKDIDFSSYKSTIKSLTKVKNDVEIKQQKQKAELSEVIDELDNPIKKTDFSKYKKFINLNESDK